VTGAIFWPPGFSGNHPMWLNRAPILHAAKSLARQNTRQHCCPIMAAERDSMAVAYFGFTWPPRNARMISHQAGDERTTCASSGVARELHKQESCQQKRRTGWLSYLNLARELLTSKNRANRQKDSMAVLSGPGGQI